MKRVLITGSKGFIGKNLIQALSRQTDIIVYEHDIDDNKSTLIAALKETDFIYHLAGINRPEKEEEFIKGNIDSTHMMLSVLGELGNAPPILMSSSTQAGLDNPYGISKRKAEDLIFEYGKKAGTTVYVYRLTNVFGKWCRPNYNSVVATFCHNISNGLEITISDAAKEIQLVYIDDVVESFLSLLQKNQNLPQQKYLSVEPIYKIKLGELADRIYLFRDMRKSLAVPDLSDTFTRCLYTTFLSYLATDNFSYMLDQRIDPRGELAELIKSPHFGQIFVSRTRPGITRGNHYHDTKIEKFIVLEGEAVIRFRHVLADEVIEYPVSGREFKVVDIPPGYTHSIENVGTNDLIVLFWADEIFDSSIPDTFLASVF
jgi:UDP-2-acetamido-2,6-beta-L-arabino-hexul-4-ose reductase